MHKGAPPQDPGSLTHLEEERERLKVEREELQLELERAKMEAERALVKLRINKEVLELRIDIEKLSQELAALQSVTARAISGKPYRPIRGETNLGGMRHTAHGQRVRWSGRPLKELHSAALVTPP